MTNSNQGWAGANNPRPEKEVVSDEEGRAFLSADPGGLPRHENNRRGAAQ